MKKGFTLTELIAVVAILSGVLLVATNLFLEGTFLQRKTLEKEEILNQISYALEYMGRELRLAQKDDLDGKSCLLGTKVNYELISTPGSGIKFKNFSGECQGFYFLNNRIMEYHEKFPQDLPLTSPKIKVSNLKFIVEGQYQPPTDYLQPRVTIILEIEKPFKAKFQTTVSQRQIDVQL